MTATEKKQQMIKAEILDIPDDTNYWFVRANSGAMFYDDFLNNNYIAVDSDNLGFGKFLSIPSTIRSSEDALKAKYKSIFNENTLQLYDDNSENKKKTSEQQKEEKTKLLTSSSLRANKSFQFVEEMNIGDFVFVPYESSSKFLVGIITTDVFDKDINHVGSKDEEGEAVYSVCPYKLKRRTVWVKELNRSQFPDKLSWIKTAHQSIFNITKFASVLNPVISPMYRYHNQVFCRIGVNTNNQISNSTWLAYQNAINDILVENNDKVYQKSKVQSPGDLIEFVKSSWWWLLPLIYQGLFGEIKFKLYAISGTFIGPLRRFLPSQKRKEKIEDEQNVSEQNLKRSQAELNSAKAEKEKAIANKIKAETQKMLRENSISTDSNDKFIKRSIQKRVERNNQRWEQNISYKRENKKGIPAKNVNTDDIQEKMQLSNENVGNEIEPKTQMDNLNPLEDESLEE